MAFGVAYTNWITSVQGAADVASITLSVTIPSGCNLLLLPWCVGDPVLVTNVNVSIGGVRAGRVVNQKGPVPQWGWTGIDKLENPAAGTYNISLAITGTNSQLALGAVAVREANLMTLGSASSNGTIATAQNVTMSTSITTAAGDLVVSSTMNDYGDYSIASQTGTVIGNGVTGSAVDSRPGAQYEFASGTPTVPSWTFNSNTSTQTGEWEVAAVKVSPGTSFVASKGSVFKPKRPGRWGGLSMGVDIREWW